MDEKKNIKFYPEEQNDPEGVFFSDPLVDRLYDSARWARFISLAGFFFSLLLIVFAFGVQALLPMIGQMSARSGGASMPANNIGIFVTVYYLVIAVACFVFYLFMFQFATKLQRALNSNAQLSLETAFAKLASFFKYWGVLTIILLCMVVLSILGIIAGTAA